MRNMSDRDTPVSSFAGSIDLLCCNRLEWETLDEREEVAWRRVDLAGHGRPCRQPSRFTTPQGEPGSVRVPAFPRDHPPRDTNRAGETFAATFVLTLLSEGWQPASAVADPELVRRAMIRSSAAAGLVLDRTDFGFPRCKTSIRHSRLARWPEVEAWIKVGRSCVCREWVAGVEPATASEPPVRRPWLRCVTLRSLTPSQHNVSASLEPSGVGGKSDPAALACFGIAAAR